MSAAEVVAVIAGVVLWGGFGYWMLTPWGWWRR